MRILVLAEFGLTGGARTSLKNLLQVNRSNNIETVLLHISDGFDTEIKKTFINEQDYIVLSNRIKLYRKPYFALIYEALVYFKYIKKINPDLIVIHSCTQTYFLFYLFTRFPVLYMLLTTSNKPSWKLLLLYKAISVSNFGQKKIFCTDSIYSAKALENFWGVGPDRVVAVYNNFNVTSKKQDNKVFNERVVLTLGHVCDYKNCFTWISVAEELTKKYANVIFKWLGDGESLEECRKLVKNNPRIQFLGHQSNIREYYEEAFLYFQPSKIESHGIAVVDAMSCHLPCVVSSAGGLKESVLNDVNGYIVESVSDVLGYMNAISLILDSQEKWHSFGQNSFYRAQNYFSPEIREKKILKLYDFLIKK